MRIAFIITRSGDLGGAQVHLRDLSSALKQLGHEPIVLAGENGVLADELRERGVEFRSLQWMTRPIRPLWDLRAVNEMRGVLRQLQPDVVSVHCTKAGVLGRVAGRSLGIPTVFTAHGWYFTEGRAPLQRTFYRWIEKAAAPLADRIVTVCEWDRDLAVRSRVAKPAEMVTIHNAMPDVEAALRAEPQASPPRLLMVARFAQQKDHLTLFRALSELMDLDWRLDLVGDGKLRPPMEEEARLLGLGPRVSFLKFRRDVPRLLAGAQVFLLISNWEGFPRSVLEGMRAGLPVVASRVGGVAEAVVDGHTGYIVPRHDVAGLRDRVRALIVDPERRRRMGAAGRARYEEYFTLDRLVARTVELYQSLLGGQAGARIPFL